MKETGTDNAAPAGLCCDWLSATVSCVKLAYGYALYATAWREKTQPHPSHAVATSFITVCEAYGLKPKRSNDKALQGRHHA